MSRIYIILLAIGAFAISAIGAVFSIFGLTSLFAGAPYSVGIMAGSLEFAKLISAGFLYRYWGHINSLMRSYLCMAVVILSVITSVGIFGYLSNAYQKSSIARKSLELEMSALQRRDQRIQAEIAKIEKFIDEIPASRITKKFDIYEESRTQMQDLLSQSQAIQSELEERRQKMLEVQTELGPITYVAEATGAPVDSLVKWFILVFVSVFDPLAICLVFALNLAIRLREKYRGNEYRIGRLALTKPVDHRYKKGA